MPYLSASAVRLPFEELLYRCPFSFEFDKFGLDNIDLIQYSTLLALLPVGWPLRHLFLKFLDAALTVILN